MIVGTPLTGSLPDGCEVFNTDYMMRRQEAYSRGALEELIELQAQYVYCEPDADELRRMAAERWRQLPQETILSFYDPDPGMAITPLLESIAIPVLVAHGREDRLVTCAASEFIASRIPGAQLYLFGDRRVLPRASQFPSYRTRGQHDTSISTGVTGRRGRAPAPTHRSL
jgi:pimeloyl-ACP methyl ester carboxylesterase